MKLSLGFSPCPNDCFIFDALVHGRIDTEGLEFDVVLADVEALNRRAFSGTIDITKLSYHAYAHLTDTYVLLNAGSALGFGVGPLLIAKTQIPVSRIPDASIAIPGKYTTANFLFSLAFPGAMNKQELLFSEIEEAVLSGKVDAGVIIHENRFTYQQKGLKKIMDLGEWWETEVKAAIPLGGIAAKRSLPDEVKHQVDRLIRKSVEFAFANPDASRSFVKAHAQEMSEEVMKKHIELYVNRYSIDLGAEGRRAVEVLFSRARQAGVIKNSAHSIFLER
jgi:1,4-dihydroxy-6-naphthoate synthase